MARTGMRPADRNPRSAAGFNPAPPRTPTARRPAMPQAVSSARPTAARPAHESQPDDAPALLHEFLTRAARRWPEHVAIEAPPSAAHPERRSITYAELDRRSDALARELREYVAGECVVAVL